MIASVQALQRGDGAGMLGVPAPIAGVPHHHHAMKTTVPTSEQIGQTMRAAALSLAWAVALAYCLGECLGRWLHNWNRDLASAYRVALVGPDPVQAATIAREQLSQELTRCTVRQLATVSGLKGKRYRKAHHVAAVLEIATAA